MMKAWVRQNYGGPDQLKLQELLLPVPSDGEVLIRVRALGINRAEIYFRKGLWGDVAPVSGIECVGEVVRDPSGRLKEGSKVAAFMGGLGRTRNGSYAQFVSARSQNVVPLNTSLPWAHLAAIPESYSTAWACLFQQLHVRPKDAVVIRGATSALGLAALNLARNAGAEVLATTRSESQTTRLIGLGVKHVIAEQPHSSLDVRRLYPHGIDSVLDLIGNSTVLDSMKMPHRGGHVCAAGFLGGAAPVSFDLLSDVAPGVYFSFFVSILFGEPGYSLEDIPLQSIVDDVEAGKFVAEPASVLNFSELPQAHVLMESDAAKGKIVVEMD
jgi:NADPH:quinone reductase